MLVGFGCGFLWGERGVGGDEYLRFLALHPFHLLEGFEERAGSLFQSCRYALIFFFIEWITRIALFWRIDLHFYKTLPDDGRAQHDAHELVYLRRDLGVETNEFEIATSMAAFADHAFGNTVERGEF